MTVTAKVKALLSIKNVEHAKLAKYLGLSRQSLSNKFFRDSFSSDDLIKIAAFLNCDLAFIIDNSTKIVLNESDLKSKRVEASGDELPPDDEIPF